MPAFHECRLINIIKTSESLCLPQTGRQADLQHRTTIAETVI